MNKDAESRWKVGMSNIKLKMRGDTLGPTIPIVLGTLQSFLRFLDWVYRGKNVMDFVQSLPTWIGLLFHPLASIALIVAGFGWLYWFERRARPIPELLGPSGSPVSLKRPILNVAWKAGLFSLVMTHLT